MRISSINRIENWFGSRYQTQVRLNIKKDDEGYSKANHD